MICSFRDRRALCASAARALLAALLALVPLAGAPVLAQPTSLRGGVGEAHDETQRALDVPREARRRDLQRATLITAPSRPITSKASTSTLVSLSTAELPASRFGFALADVTTSPGTTLEQARQAGAGWMLGWISWRRHEPSPGAYAWLSGANDFDNILRAASWAGLKVLVRVDETPAWATTDGTGHTATADPAAPRSFMRALAGYGGARVAAYQLFNEPNLARIRATSPRAFSEMHRLHASSAARAMLALSSR